MSVRKPLSKQNEIDIEALIDKGAKVKEDFLEDDKEWKYIKLRISADMLKEVDEVVSARVGITRTGWLLESIAKELKRIGKK